MRENCTHGSEGGVGERLSLPLSAGSPQHSPPSPPVPPMTTHREPTMRHCLILLLAALPPLAAWAQSRPLNDTGITRSGHAIGGNATVCDPAHPAGQDCHYGRDAAAAAGQLPKIGGSADHLEVDVTDEFDGQPEQGAPDE